MHRLSPLAAALSAAALAAPAQAEKITLGSDLSSPATLVQAQGADTAFWPLANAGTTFTIPADGQILTIRMKGSALREQGAGDPANMIHFQTLDPAGANGARTVYKTSAFFNMPIDAPAAITTFQPENLCARKGGSVAFNTIGGFGWNGGDPFNPNPPNPSYYRSGTPWQIFAAAAGSKTAWYSKDNGTQDGMTLTPAGGTDAVGGYGRVEDGRELLMQVVLGTGDDVSYECGGPRRDGSGNIIREMSVNPNQTAGVARDGSFNVLGYCGSRVGDCTGATATVTVGGRTVAAGPFSARQTETIKVPLKLAAADYIALANAPGATQDAVLTLSSSLGTFSGAIKLRAPAGRTLTVPSQRPYVRNDRTLTPYAICTLPGGCSGTATLTAKGRTLAKGRFTSRRRGAVLVRMRLSKPAFKALKKARRMTATLTVTGPTGAASRTVTLRK